MKAASPVVAILIGVMLSFGTEAAEHLKTPHQIIGQLRLRITSIGQTTKDVHDYEIATQAALDDLHTFIETGPDLTGLTEKDKWGKTPLNLAAYLGFSEIVTALLAQPSVAISLNEPDDTGVTPWTYSVFAARQSAFACNPKIFTSPFSWAPLHQSQAYYTARDPYPVVRKLLEDAGAHQDMAQAKRQWNEICKYQSDEVRAELEATPDLQPAVIEAGRRALDAFLKKIQRR
ncbi:hypothetical protein [Magnetovibrio sp.]|uniref:hypothetical protein n=1 Tax=Magnetovibrio sp. TaxID=2024836 RepID=UPI002F952A74